MPKAQTKAQATTSKPKREGSRELATRWREKGKCQDAGRAKERRRDCQTRATMIRSWKKNAKSKEIRGLWWYLARTMRRPRRWVHNLIEKSKIQTHRQRKKKKTSKRRFNRQCRSSSWWRFQAVVVVVISSSSVINVERTFNRWKLDKPRKLKFDDLNGFSVWLWSIRHKRLRRYGRQ